MKKKDLIKYKRLFNLMKPLTESNFGEKKEVKTSRIEALKELKLDENQNKLAMFLMEAPATVGTRNRVYCSVGRNRSDYDSIRFLKGLGLNAEEALSAYIKTIYSMFSGGKKNSSHGAFGEILYCGDVGRLVVACNKTYGHGHLMYIEKSCPMFFGSTLSLTKAFVDKSNFVHNAESASIKVLNETV